MCRMFKIFVVYKCNVKYKYYFLVNIIIIIDYYCFFLNYNCIIILVKNEMFLKVCNLLFLFYVLKYELK